jgi:hypothetical protein
LIRVWSIVNVQCVLLVWFISYIYIYPGATVFSSFLGRPLFFRLTICCLGDILWLLLSRHVYFLAL